MDSLKLYIGPNIYVSYLVDLSVSIHIRSEGCEDPGITEGTCGLAYIDVNGEDESPHIRGHNVVVVDAVTGNVTTVQKSQCRCRFSCISCRCRVLAAHSIRLSLISNSLVACF